MSEVSKNQAYAQSVIKEQFDQTGAALDYDQTVTWLIEIVRDLPRDGTLVVSLVGGAASGKSTLTQSLADGLAATGMRADTIATDDFNKGDRAWRKENYDDKVSLGASPEEVDPLKLKDFDLLNQKIDEIKALSGVETVAVPTYNPLTGLAIDEGEAQYKHHISQLDVLLVEGDFHAVARPDLLIFIHMADELRLQNRVSRDVVSRGGELAKAADSFHFRQRYQHIPLTLPVIEEADVILDASTDALGWRYNVYTRKK